LGFEQLSPDKNENIFFFKVCPLSIVNYTFLVKILVRKARCPSSLKHCEEKFLCWHNLIPIFKNALQIILRFVGACNEEPPVPFN